MPVVRQHLSACDNAAASLTAESHDRSAAAGDRLDVNTFTTKHRKRLAGRQTQNFRKQHPHRYRALVAAQNVLCSNQSIRKAGPTARRTHLEVVYYFSSSGFPSARPAP